VILQSYIRPGLAGPGDTFTLTLEVANVGGPAAEDVQPDPGRRGRAPRFKPFALLSSGKHRLAPHPAGGQSEPVELAWCSTGTSDSGVYSLSGRGHLRQAPVSTTKTQVLNLVVQRQPQMRIGCLSRRGTGMVDQSIDLPIEVVNLAAVPATWGMVEVSSYKMDVQQGSLFLGPLEGGTSGS
jgi:hypothetical protein